MCRRAHNLPSSHRLLERTLQFLPMAQRSVLVLVLAVPMVLVPAGLVLRDLGVDFLGGRVAVLAGVAGVVLDLAVADLVADQALAVEHPAARSLAVMRRALSAWKGTRFSSNSPTIPSQTC